MGGLGVSQTPPNFVGTVRGLREFGKGIMHRNVVCAEPSSTQHIEGVAASGCSEFKPEDE